MRWPNDWKIKDCLLLCGGITIVQIILVLLAQMGLDIPVLHQLTGFIFTTFIPGILLLRIFKTHDINIVESIAYSAGLSIALVMFSGATINFILPLINIRQPVTSYPILITLTVEIAALMVAAWFGDRGYSGRIFEKQFSLLPCANSILFLLIVLLLVILGVKVSDMTGSNLVLIISLVLIALVIGLAAFKKFIKPDIYPFAIFIISLSLLYQTTLMSPYLIGSDIYTEYLYYHEVAANGIWNCSLPNPVNSCLSIVMLGPIYSLMMGIDGIWVFKAVYPLLFSLVPLILFRIFRFQIGTVPSFFAVFFFMAVPTFSLEMISLCRQQVAEIFLALAILLLIERKLPKAPKLIMLIIFSLSIAVSHYSIGFITVAFLVLAVILLAITRSKLFLDIWGRMTSRTGGIPSSIRDTKDNALPLKLLIIPVALYVLFLLAWYSQVASGINLYFISSVLNFQVNAANQEFTNGWATSPLLQLGSRPDLIRTALGLDFFEASILGKLFRLLQYLTQVLLILGCFRLLLHPRGLKLDGTYLTLSVISVGLLAACVIFPGFAAILNATRWYHIGLLILAPFFIIGAETAIGLLIFIWSKLRKNIAVAEATADLHQRYFGYMALCILIPYFIFTSGIVYEIGKQKITDSVDVPYSLALSSYRLDLTGILSTRDEAGAKWLGQKATSSEMYVYCDIHSSKIFSIFRATLHVVWIPLEEELLNPSYVYLTARNTDSQQITLAEPGKPGLRKYVSFNDITSLKQAIHEGSTIYSNGGSVIFLTR